jgi:hypothetical protein
MCFLKKFYLFVLAFVFCTVSTHAHENKCVFVGQNGGESVFTLEILGNFPANHLQIDENGEVHIKVDRIIAVSKELFSQESASSDSANSINQFLAFMNQNRAIGYHDEIGSFVFEDYALDSNGGSSRAKKWQCPYCYMWWEYGERCKNPACPTNQWNKE